MNKTVPLISRRQLLGSVASAGAAVALTPLGIAAESSSGILREQSGASSRPEPLTSVADYEKAARGKMTPMASEYVNGGAADEHTLSWNQSAYSDIKLRQRVLVDVSRIDTSVRLFGRVLAHPILLAMALTGRPSIAAIDRGVLWN